MGNKYPISNRLSMNLMTFVTQIGPKLVENIERSDLPKRISFMRDKTTSTLFLKPTDQNDIRSIVLKCKSKICLVSDNLSMYSKLYYTTSIAQPLTYIFNMYFKKDKFQSKMKLVKKISLFLKIEKVMYLTIALFYYYPKMSKILEKLFSRRLLSFLPNNNPINDSQNGFSCDSKCN